MVAPVLETVFARGCDEQRETLRVHRVSIMAVHDVEGFRLNDDPCVLACNAENLILAEVVKIPSQSGRK
jgi:hypothetical protein